MTEKKKSKDNKQNLPASRKEELPATQNDEWLLKIFNDSSPILGEGGKKLYEYTEKNLRKIGKSLAKKINRFELSEIQLNYFLIPKFVWKHRIDMAMEENETIQEMWANLISNAINSPQDFKDLKIYADILSKMEPDGAIFLEVVGRHFGWIPRSEGHKRNWSKLGIHTGGGGLRRALWDYDWAKIGIDTTSEDLRRAKEKYERLSKRQDHFFSGGQVLFHFFSVLYGWNRERTEAAIDFLVNLDLLEVPTFQAGKKPEDRKLRLGQRRKEQDDPGLDPELIVKKVVGDLISACYEPVAQKKKTEK